MLDFLCHQSHIPLKDATCWLVSQLLKCVIEYRHKYILYTTITYVLEWKNNIVFIQNTLVSAEALHDPLWFMYVFCVDPWLELLASLASDF